MLGISFDEWQDGLGRAILARRADGLYAADTVAISIPRQVGKTYLIGWISFALCLIHPGLSVIWTAHRFKTARETFSSMKAMANRPRMLAHIDHVASSAADMGIYFANGSRIIFGARERGFGRGFAKVDVLVLDEAQILTANAMDDMVPATNAAPDALVVLTGTPPKPTDPGDIFTQIRREAISGESSDSLYVELAADRDADPNDREQLRKANPSYPDRTPERAILRMKKNLGPDSFLREGLGIWDEDAKRSDIDMLHWAACADEGSSISSPPALAVDVSPFGWTAIGVAGRREDGLWHVEVPMFRSGTSWVPREVQRICVKNSIPSVRLNPTGPAGSLIPKLVALGVQVETISNSELAQASGMFVESVNDESLRHLDDHYLNKSAEGGVRRKVGDALVWSRAESSLGAAPVIAVTEALWTVAQVDYDLASNVW